MALLSPYHGGSHAAWSDGLTRHSRHRIEAATLPALNWRWRMEGAALELAGRATATNRPDVVLATDMLDLATFLARVRHPWGPLPAVLYMHENQLTYPVSTLLEPNSTLHSERVRQCGLIHVKSMAVADRVVFNSDYHRAAWNEALPDFRRRFPEPLPGGLMKEIAARTNTIPVGVEVGPSLPAADPRPPLVLWNQRWEYDKNPDDLMRILQAVADRGIDFEVAFCGERPGRVPESLSAGLDRLGERVVHRGYLPRHEYVSLLSRARVVLSTANHEFFGISVVEAICAGAHPLLPDRLSYPGLIPRRLADACLYDSPETAAAMLAAELAAEDSTRGRALELASDLRGRFAWSAVIDRYDDLLADTERSAQRRSLRDGVARSGWNE